jgi:Ca2+-binding EF-hand superfamily protein
MPASPSTSPNADQLLGKVRAKLQERGTRGFIGIRRVFKIADYNNSGSLCESEFLQVFRDYRLQVSDEELRMVFKMFDTDHSGQIDFNEFLRHVVGEMNDF